MLHAAMPNPFLTGTVFAYDLAQRTRVTLRVYDVSGRVVRSLVAGAEQDAGRYSIEWDGRDDAGRAAAAGLYFARLDAGGRSDMRRLARMR